jgi:hypothetical protein
MSQESKQRSTGNPTEWQFHEKEKGHLHHCGLAYREDVTGEQAEVYRNPTELHVYERERVICIIVVWLTGKMSLESKQRSAQATIGQE